MAEKDFKKKKSREKSFYKAISIITDILIIPIIFVAILSAVSMLNAKNNNRVPSLFGYSAVTILSDSMEPSGYNVGDVVLIKEVKINELRRGDIIAFYYRYVQDLNKPISDTDNSFAYTWDENSMPASDIVSGSEKNYINDASNTSTKIYFHEIVDIKIEAETGRLWFKTKGTKNVSADQYWIDQGYVIGEHAKSLGILSKIITFTGSISGIIWLVEVPCGIILILLVTSFINQLDQALKNKKNKHYKLNKVLMKNKAKVLGNARRLAIRRIANFNRNWEVRHFYVYEADSYTLAYRIARVQALKMRTLQRSYQRANNNQR